jgi:hypothetical protein
MRPSIFIFLFSLQFSMKRNLYLIPPTSSHRITHCMSLESPTFAPTPLPSHDPSLEPSPEPTPSP